VILPQLGHRARSQLRDPAPSSEAVQVTLDTVKKHVSHVLDKLGAANRTQAADRARQLGLIR